ncbi:uncharacterized protein FFM5_06668 [Fusarium fujikuroi]|nr:uncharacterized protein FFM5_06668 [Fusarium fujikuroi]
MVPGGLMQPSAQFELKVVLNSREKPDGIRKYK